MKDGPFSSTSVKRRGIKWSSEDAGSHPPAATRVETCCSLPGTRAICSTDCTETHAASTAAAPLGGGSQRGVSRYFRTFSLIPSDCFYPLALIGVNRRRR